MSWFFLKMGVGWSFPSEELSCTKYWCLSIIFSDCCVLSPGDRASWRGQTYHDEPFHRVCLLLPPQNLFWDWQFPSPIYFLLAPGSAAHTPQDWPSCVWAHLSLALLTPIFSLLWNALQSLGPMSTITFSMRAFSWGKKYMHRVYKPKSKMNSSHTSPTLRGKDLELFLFFELLLVISININSMTLPSYLNFLTLNSILWYYYR